MRSARSQLLRANRSIRTTHPRVASATNGAGELTSEIDASLKEKGIDAGDNNVASRPPTPDLPQITEEPAPSPASAKAKAAKASAKEVLGKVDAGLKKDGKSPAEVPEPPKLIVKRRSETEKGKKTQSSLFSAGMLGTIDKKLMKKGIEMPKEGDASITGNMQAATPVSQPTSRPTVELSPRLSRETSPFLINPGKFQLEEKPVTAEQPKNSQSVEAVQPANPQGIVPIFELPASVTQTQTTTLPEKKEKTASNDTPDGASEGDSANDAFGQIKSELGKFKQLMGPLFGQQSDPNYKISKSPIRNPPQNTNFKFASRKADSVLSNEY